MSKLTHLDDEGAFAGVQDDFGRGLAVDGDGGPRGAFAVRQAPGVEGGAKGVGEALRGIDQAAAGHVVVRGAFVAQGRVAEDQGSRLQVVAEAARRAYGDEAVHPEGDQLLEHDCGGRSAHAEIAGYGDAAALVVEVAQLAGEIAFRRGDFVLGADMVEERGLIGEDDGLGGRPVAELAHIADVADEIRGIEEWLGLVLGRVEGYGHAASDLSLTDGRAFDQGHPALFLKSPLPVMM